MCSMVDVIDGYFLGRETPIPTSLVYMNIRGLQSGKRRLFVVVKTVPVSLLKSAVLEILISFPYLNLKLPL